MYTDEEFEAAFRKVDKDGSGFITPDEVEALLYETYGYPALEDEVRMFMDIFDENKDNKISLDEFKTQLGVLREQLKSKDDVGKEYKSYN